MSEEMTFYRQQRAQLFALGIIDYDDQSQTARRGERRLPALVTRWSHRHRCGSRWNQLTHELAR